MLGWTGFYCPKRKTGWAFQNCTNLPFRNAEWVVAAPKLLKMGYFFFGGLPADVTGWVGGYDGSSAGCARESACGARRQRTAKRGAAPARGGADLAAAIHLAGDG